MSFVKAQKIKAKLRLALCGLAGTGKSFSSLAIATALSRRIQAAGTGEGRIAALDSERGSLSLYADRFSFDVCELDSFSPLTYAEKIQEAERAGYDIIIADSISHAWAGKDGALDLKDQVSERSGSGNSWTAWRSVTPKHNAFVDAMVGCKAHFIATMRTKMEYAQETVNGKVQITKLGLAAIQREGLEYEFTLVGDVDHAHALKISKSRCDGFIEIGDQFEKPGENFVGRIWDWLQRGADAPPPRVEPALISASDLLGDAAAVSFAAFIAGMESARTQAELDAAASGPGKPNPGTPDHRRATDVYMARAAALQAAA